MKKLLISAWKTIRVVAVAAWMIGSLYCLWDIRQELAKTTNTVTSLDNELTGSISRHINSQLSDGLLNEIADDVSSLKSSVSSLESSVSSIEWDVNQINKIGVTVYR